MDDERMASDRKPRIELPVLVDDAGLSPYAFRLYAHIKRVAGDDKTCYQGTRTMADVCRMSLGQVSRAKAELVAAGLITLAKKSTRGGLVDEIRVVDVWEANRAKYPPSVQVVNTSESDQDMNTSRQSVQPVNTNPLSVHTVNASAPDEAESVHTVNVSVHQVNERRSLEEDLTHVAPVAADAAPSPPAGKKPRAERKPRTPKAEPEPTPEIVRRTIARGSQVDYDHGEQGDIVQVNLAARYLWDHQRLPDETPEALCNRIKAAGRWIRQTQHPYRDSLQRMPPSALKKHWQGWLDSVTPTPAQPAPAAVLEPYDYDNEPSPYAVRAAEQAARRNGSRP